MYDSHATSHFGINMDDRNVPSAQLSSTKHNSKHSSYGLGSLSPYKPPW